MHEGLRAAGTVAVSQTQAICGLGGIGKTQAVVEYAYRYRDSYQAAFWVKADRHNNALADFLALASLLNLPEKDAPDQTITLAAIHRWLQMHTAWLLIFDNADDLAVVRAFLPPAHKGHILLTSRVQAAGGLARRIEIETMGPEEGALLLLRRASLIDTHVSFEQVSPAHRETALEIVRELGGLPLALDQAGAYIEESSCHLTDYLRLYRQQRSALLARRGGLTADHPEPVMTTWSLSFRQVEQADALAADLLRLCAFLDPDAIPEEILAEAIHEMDTTSDAVSPGELRLNDALAALLRFSLIRRNAETRTLAIHRLVQAVIQDTMDKDAQREWAGRGAKIVKRVFPQISTTYSAAGYPHRAVLLLRASIHLDQENDNTQNMAAALWGLAVQQQVIGKLFASEQSLQESIARSHSTEDHFNEAKAHQYLAVLRAYQGQFEIALSLLDTASSLFKRSDAARAESAVWAYRALCGLLSQKNTLAMTAARSAQESGYKNGEERDIIRSEWLLGWACIRLATQEPERRREFLREAEQHLQVALEQCHRTQTVYYEADLLLVQARLYHAKGDKHQAKTCGIAALAITIRSDFRLLRADVRNFLAQLALEDKDYKEALSMAQAAFDDALCDGSPYCYTLAFEDAKYLLNEAIQR